MSERIIQQKASDRIEVLPEAKESLFLLLIGFVYQVFVFGAGEDVC